MTHLTPRLASRICVRMPTMKRNLGRLLVGVLVLTGGCAYFQRQEAKKTEPILSAAGFQMKLADTPEQLDRIKAMPQRQLRPLKRGGKLYFAYADAQGCRCVYLGDQAAYRRYQDLAFQQQMAAEDRETAVVDEDAAIIDDDAVWDSWGFDVW